MSEPAAAPLSPPKRSFKERLAALFEEYGQIALVTYFTLSLLTIAGFSIAIGVGAKPSSATGVLGVIGAGWLAGKATMPIRIPLALLLTPGVAALWHRWRRKPAPSATEPTNEPTNEPSAAG